MDNDNGSLNKKKAARPAFPERAVVTGGMPYGNKPLHFAHIGGYYVHADMLARFLRDRIGSENVIFVSGTDCYGSPLAEDYRKRVESGEYGGTIEQLAQSNYEAHKKTLADYKISLDFFGGSSVEPAARRHKDMSDLFLRGLHANGHLAKMSSAQFYDTERGVFLNGRQVIGRCPVEGCRSEKGYADECDLGHQYMPQDLIAPISSLSGKTPELRESVNWYVKMEELRPLLQKWADEFGGRATTRPFVAKGINEFLEPPIIYLMRDFLAELEGLEGLPEYKLEDDGKSSSVKLVFTQLGDREAACGRLSANGIRYRTGKTIVPFRLTGNLDWGVPAPPLDGLEGLTIWVWPESLWAPISFTDTYLSENGAPEGEWKKWWASPRAKVYQFIGQDNIYFYGPAQTAIFLGMQGSEPSASPGDGDLSLTDLIVSNHILFLNKKASSSGAVKPPMADELLAHYTADQLRAHFLALGLGLRSVSFAPKPLNPGANEKDADPVLKDGNLLTNVLNRIARSCFYTSQKHYGGAHPAAQPSQGARDAAAEAALDYEALISRCEFHQVMNLLDAYIRRINKDWDRGIKEADKADKDSAADRNSAADKAATVDKSANADGDTGGGTDGAVLRSQILSDTLHMLRVAAVLVHPLAPNGAEMIADYLLPGCNNKTFFSWDNIFKTLHELAPEPENIKFTFLEQRVDFFKKHESQLINNP
ncbi:MAG: class I tRNA ligase family protein [Oscillospiraceae bacterium]|nr:class I tRNA ligase family protein [Oscillospiraceae bacterium]